MRSLALHGALRRQLAWLHRWTGLVVLGFLFLASVTGTWLVFADEIDHWINPELRSVVIRDHRVPLSAVYDRVERRFPGARVTTIVTQKKPSDALLVYLASDRGELRYNQVFVDPYTGDILGQQSTTRFVVSRSTLNQLVLRFHYTLFAGNWGLWCMGGCAIVWLLTNLIGLWLSWPSAWRRLVGWLPILSVRMNRGVYKVNYDLHRAIGVWLLPVFTVLAFTSVYLNLPRLIAPAVDAVSPLSKAPAGHRRQLEDVKVGPDQAVAVARAAVPFARPNSVFRDLRNGRYSVWLQRADDPSPYGNNVAYVDFVTGDLIGVRLSKSGSAGDQFMDWQLPLHNGMAFGLAGRIVIAVSGIAMAVMCVTGFYVWWRKWRDGRRVRKAASHMASPMKQATPQASPDRRVAARQRTVLDTEQTV
jgi:uncharacterized iron-regulated membrane protein